MESSSPSRRAVRAVALILVSSAAVCLPIAPASAGLVRDAGCAPKPAAATAPPVGLDGCPGVRPGAYVQVGGSGCTLGFLFSVKEPTKDGTRTMRYIATAGHCVLGQPGERSWAYNQGPRAYASSGAKIGEFVYAVHDYGDTWVGPYRDFGMIRLDAAITSRAQVCHFGGPIATNNNISPEPVPIHHYGQGLGVGQTLPGRTSVARLNDPNVAGGVGVINYGDSGAPVITGDGKAVGLIVQFFDESGPGTFGITRLRPQVLRAEHVLKVDMTLLTAALR